MNPPPPPDHPYPFEKPPAPDRPLINQLPPERPIRPFVNGVPLPEQIVPQGNRPWTWNRPGEYRLFIKYHLSLIFRISVYSLLF